MAAFNNGFPVTYPQMIYPQYQPVQPAQIAPAGAQTQQQSQQSSIIWVQGEAGAKSYLVAPNTTVQLWDSESQTIYLKSADASGMPSMKVLDYTIRDQARNVPNSLATDTDNKSITYATKEEMKAISEQITALRDRVDNLTKRRNREVSENE